MENDKAYYRLAFKIFSDFSAAIAIPALSAVFAGKWLDTKFQTAPRYLAILLLMAFIFTSLMIVKKAHTYKQQYLAIIAIDEKKDPENKINKV